MKEPDSGGPIGVEEAKGSRWDQQNIIDEGGKQVLFDISDHRATQANGVMTRAVKITSTVPLGAGDPKSVLTYPY